MSSRISVCIFAPQGNLLDSLTELLNSKRYDLHILNSATELKGFIVNQKEHLDCLILQENDCTGLILNELYEQGLVLPVILIQTEPQSPKNYLYHSAEVRISPEQLRNIASYIDKAIGQFLQLAPSCSLKEKPADTRHQEKIQEKQNFLLLQQRRLAEKLKERLGYLGVYYKRNPSYFYRHLSQAEKEELIRQLTEQYKEIILNYFSQDSNVNQAIDQFVNQAFFADISVSQILEIHMELMDEFSQQLKLEGRNDDILLDYRLALIDIIAHLCEMYRRSIPKEDLPFDTLFTVD
ncbi:MAG TPA: circadian clock protein KaiA [Geminocystis sp. M7585_C2015_104]|nr:circadian clock protein KaiA [Geminocystis sp. M7585_C2015_104]